MRDAKAQRRDTHIHGVREVGREDHGPANAVDSAMAKDLCTVAVEMAARKGKSLDVITASVSTLLDLVFVQTKFVGFCAWKEKGTGRGTLGKKMKMINKPISYLRLS